MPVSQEPSSLGERYEVARTVDFVCSRGFTRVALQFPDHLLGEAALVAEAVETACQRKVECLQQAGQPTPAEVPRFFVLADTTFGSCCVDEVAAAHVNAQCIIHYGPACLSPVSRHAAQYVFGRDPIDIQHCAALIHRHSEQVQRQKEEEEAQLLTQRSDVSTARPAATPKATILVLFDLEYAHATNELERTLHSSTDLCSKVVMARVACTEMMPTEVPVAELGNSTAAAGACGQGSCGTPGSCAHSAPASSSAERLAPTTQALTSSAVPGSSASARRVQNGLGALLWDLEAGTDIADCVLVWVGRDSPALTNILLRLPFNRISQYNPETNIWTPEVAGMSKVLKRRYFLVQKAKEANIVGVLVGTLGVAGYRDALGHIHELIKAAGKKPYMFAMGKVNPAKLANFPEVDVFVLVSCTQNALIESKDFYAPVITPFEAELAFSPRDRDWPGHLQLDFLEEDVQELEAEADDQEQEPTPRFSLVSGGQLCAAHPSMNVPDAPGEALQLGEEGGQHQLALRAERALGLRQDATALAHAEVRSGADYLLLRREHTGLEASRVAEAGVESLEPVVGREGRAAGYIDEAATRCGSNVATRVNALQLETELEDFEQLAPTGSTNVSLESEPQCMMYPPKGA